MAQWLLVALFAVHVALGVQRFLGKSLPRRLAEIAAYRTHGAVRFSLRNRSSVEAVEQVLARSGDDGIVLIRGVLHGDMELACGLLAPRLLVGAVSVPAGATAFHGRPLVRGPVGGLGPGVLVLVGEAQGLRLELRQ